ncbi:hypothetical protein C8F01DRAFT_269365 [Mycena amicta]|nr:hypothetical protein C8F01DRAFT_269365 [Mycena amicta]
MAAKAQAQGEAVETQGEGRGKKAVGTCGDPLDPDKRDNPTCKNFLENKEVQRTIFPKGKAKVLNHTGRAICRIMSRNATKCWSVGDIGYIFGVSHTSVRRAIDNVFKPPDNVDEDYEHAGDPAFKIEFPPLPEPPTLRNAHRETQVRAGIHIGASNFSHPQSMSPVSGQDSSNRGSQSSKAEVFSTTGLDRAAKRTFYKRLTEPESSPVDDSSSQEDTSPTSTQKKRSHAEYSRSNKEFDLGGSPLRR